MTSQAMAERYERTLSEVAVEARSALLDRMAEYAVAADKLDRLRRRDEMLIDRLVQALDRARRVTPRAVIGANTNVFHAVSLALGEGRRRLDPKTNPLDDVGDE